MDDVGALSYLDQRLSKKRGRGLRMVGTRERNVLTRLGVARVKRRYYRDPEGRHRFLPDEAVGWGRGGMAVTPVLEAQALEMCSEASYRRSAKHLPLFLSEDVEHALLHRLVRKRVREGGREEGAGPGALPPGSPSPLGEEGGNPSHRL